LRAKAVQNLLGVGICSRAVSRHQAADNQHRRKRAPPVEGPTQARRATPPSLRSSQRKGLRNHVRALDRQRRAPFLSSRFGKLLLPGRVIVNVCRILASTNRRCNRFNRGVSPKGGSHSG
jgi:hypothetical protein